MPAQRIAFRNPIWLLVVAGVCFVGWVAYDAAAPAEPKPTRTPEPAPISGPPREQLVNNKVLISLQIGMPRTAVEDRLNDRFDAPEPGPVDLSAGTPVYQSQYRATLFYRLPQVNPEGAFTPGPHIVTLEYDAGRPGHPLTRILATPVEPAGA